MPRLIWSAHALEDVARLHAFLKPKNPGAAARAVKAIRHGIRMIAAHPQAGRPVDYRARYRYDGGDVLILAVRHRKEAGY